jgi:hypothetical protein
MTLVRRPDMAVTVVTVPPPHRAVGALDRWIAGSIPAGSAVLNVGAGHNLSGQLPRTRRRAGRLVGVDPTERIHLNDSLDERHQATLQRFAPERSGSRRSTGPSATPPSPSSCSSTSPTRAASPPPSLRPSNRAEPCSG